MWSTILGSCTACTASDGQKEFECDHQCGFKGTLPMVENHELSCAMRAAPAAAEAETGSKKAVGLGLAPGAPGERRDRDQHSKELLVRGPTTWTVTRYDGPNHLGLWSNALPEHQMALITSDCASRR